MALPSQMSRSGPAVARRGMRRATYRPRRNRRLVVPGVIFGVILLLGWILWPKGEGRLQPADASTDLATHSSSSLGAGPDNLPIVSFGSDEGDEQLIRRSPVAAGQISSEQTLTMGSTPPQAKPIEERKEPERAPSQTAPAQSRQTPAAGSSVASTLQAQAESALSRNRPLEARNLLNRALHHSTTSERDRRRIRSQLSELNELLVFSAKAVPGDTLAQRYTVEKGDSLSEIVREKGLQIEWQLLSRINGVEPSRLRIGQSIKVVRGPFHAIVSKSDFRMDMYSDERDSDGNRLFITSFDVGLGEFGSTPTGLCEVSRRKNINPDWRNPRTGEYFGADDPMNPIGERWIGLEGIDEHTQTQYGYGIHGTVKPESIGREESMGCVRCRDADIELIYEMLVPGKSKVEILP